GLYKFAGDKNGNAAIVNGTLSSNLLESIFDKKKDEVVEKVAEYTGTANDYAANIMEQIAGEAIQVIKENIPGETSDGAVRRFLINLRNNILLYLPADLQLGNVFQADTFDDSNHNMEGPD